MGDARAELTGLMDVAGASDQIRDRRYLLVAPSGVSALVSTWGAALVALHMPDRSGRFADVVLGFDTADDYAAHAGMYFGCTVGRVAQRIRGASFTLDGTTYSLATNNGRNSIHGGAVRSFDKVEWAADPRGSRHAPSVVFRHASPHLEEGYPGRLEATVTYTMTDLDELRIDYEARSDQTTPVNFTTHTYWNLSGAGADSILGHELEVSADSYTPTDDELIPLGSIESVDGTPLDFRTPNTFQARIAELEAGGTRGYDHNYVLSGTRAEPAFAARLRDPASGRVVEIWTTQPCLQVYSGNLMTPTTGKWGARYAPRSGLCLEPQGYPDAMNNPAFGTVLLKPDDVYRHTIIFRLMTDES